MLDNVPLLGMKTKLSMFDADEPICCSLLDDMHESDRVDNFEFLASNDDKNLSGFLVSERDGSVVSDSTDSNCNTHKGIEVALCVDSTCIPNPVVNNLRAYAGKRPPKCVKQFDQVERAGTEITYRCVNCRDCIKCKYGGRVDSISIQEEIEQTLIERSVTVYIENGTTTAILPFVVDAR